MAKYIRILLLKQLDNVLFTQFVEILLQFKVQNLHQKVIYVSHITI